MLGQRVNSGTAKQKDRRMILPRPANAGTKAPRPLVGEAALLIGDAAGLAYPRSGEGIRPAVESGMLAALTLIEADGCYDRDHLDVYAQRVTARFGRRELTSSHPPPSKR